MVTVVVTTFTYHTWSDAETDDESWPWSRPAGGPETVLIAAGELTPDVVICDIRMPPSYTLEGLAAAREPHPGN